MFLEDFMFGYNYIDDETESWKEEAAQKASWDIANKGNIWFEK